MTTSALPRHAAASNKKFLIGGLFVLAAVAFLIVSGLQDSGLLYFQTLSEARTQVRAGDGRVVRINGVADMNSVKWDGQKLDLTFDIIEGTSRMPVYYHGVMPDTFYQSESVVVEGTLNRQGVFEARSLLVKCPSRYEPVVAPASSS
ncbi:MAG: cytochrome c maturation protein CcmE [Chloroflexi bacterium]|nr:cytochrome c maturation protein CcmE [Chloroflexota bacterium]